MALPQFPTLLGLAFPVIRRNMGFDVVKLQSISGVRSRYALRNAPMYQWEVSFEFLRDFAPAPVLTTFSDGMTFSDGSEFAQSIYAELQTFMGFYNSLLGAQSPFLYTDTADNTTGVNEVIGTGDGSTQQFQLVRSFGGFTEPVYGSPAVKYLTVGGTLVTTGFTVSQTGVVSFVTAPAAGAVIAWQGTYQWLCQFDDDSIEFSNFMGGYWEAKSIKFSNLVLP